MPVIIKKQLAGSIVNQNGNLIWGKTSFSKTSKILMLAIASWTKWLTPNSLFPARTRVNRSSKFLFCDASIRTKMLLWQCGVHAFLRILWRSARPENGCHAQHFPILPWHQIGFLACLRLVTWAPFCNGTNIGQRWMARRSNSTCWYTHSGSRLPKQL